MTNEQPGLDPSMILGWYLRHREELYKSATLSIIIGRQHDLGELIQTSQRMAHILEKANMALPPPRDTLRRPAYAASCVIVRDDPRMMIEYYDPPTEA